MALPPRAVQPVIEQRRVRDVGYRMITGGQRPADLAGLLAAAAAAPHWHERERALAGACEILLGAQRARGLPASALAVIPFWGRPYRTVDDAIRESLLSAITDPDLRRLPTIGSIEQWVSSVDVLASPARRAALRTAYQAWARSG